MYIYLDAVSLYRFLNKYTNARDVYILFIFGYSQCKKIQYMWYNVFTINKNMQYLTIHSFQKRTTVSIEYIYNVR